VEGTLIYGFSFSTGRVPRFRRSGEGGGAPTGTSEGGPDIDFGIQMLERISEFNTAFPLGPPKGEFDLDLKITVPLGLYKFIAGASFKWEHGIEDVFEVRAFVGFGIGVPDNPIFSLEFSASLGVIFTVQGTNFGFGGILDIAFEMAILPWLPVVSFGFEGEVACVFHAHVADGDVWLSGYTPTGTSDLTHRSDLGQQLGTVYSGPRGYAVGWWQGLIHAELFCFFSISFEFEYSFACPI
jgi:hypothetical protein